LGWPDETGLEGPMQKIGLGPNLSGLKVAR